MQVVRANSWGFEDLRTESDESKEKKHRYKDVPRYSNPIYGKSSDLSALFPDSSIYVARTTDNGREVVKGCQEASEGDSIPAYIRYKKAQSAPPPVSYEDSILYDCCNIGLSLKGRTVVAVVPSRIQRTVGLRDNTPSLLRRQRSRVGRGNRSGCRTA